MHSVQIMDNLFEILFPNFEWIVPKGTPQSPSVWAAKYRIKIYLYIDSREHSQFSTFGLTTTTST